MSNKNTVLFRADANPSIGFGHIMRCLSIADAVSALHWEVLFILADDAVQELVTDWGFQSIILGTACNDLEEEAEKVSLIIA